MKTAESSARAIKTCWQREMEKKTNTRWATLLGRKLYLFSFNLINPQRGPHFVDQKRGTHVPPPANSYSSHGVAEPSVLPSCSRCHWAVLKQRWGNCPDMLKDM